MIAFINVSFPNLAPKVAKITHVLKITEPIQIQNCAVKMAGVSDSTNEISAFVEPIASISTLKVGTVARDSQGRPPNAHARRARIWGVITRVVHETK